MVPRRSPFPRPQQAPFMPSMQAGPLTAQAPGAPTTLWMQGSDGCRPVRRLFRSQTAHGANGWRRPIAQVVVEEGQLQAIEGRRSNQGWVQSPIPRREVTAGAEAAVLQIENPFELGIPPARANRHRVTQQRLGGSCTRSTVSMAGIEAEPAQAHAALGHAAPAGQAVLKESAASQAVADRPAMPSPHRAAPGYRPSAAGPKARPAPKRWGAAVAGPVQRSSRPAIAGNQQSAGFVWVVRTGAGEALVGEAIAANRPFGSRAGCGAQGQGGGPIGLGLLGKTGQSCRRVATPRTSCTATRYALTGINQVGWALGHR